MKGISYLNVNSIKNWDTDVNISENKWVPARPIGLTGLRWRVYMAWLVFTGKCDVLYWDNDK